MTETDTNTETPTKVNYVSKEEFHKLLCEYKKECEEAENAGEPHPQIPDSIGAELILICERLATKGNFYRYTYKDEMCLDAIENCVRALKTFDPEQSKKNPFGYFTKIAWYAFLRRIKKEKKQTYYKYKTYEAFIIESCLNGQQDVYGQVDITNDKMEPILKEFDKKPKSKKSKSTKKEGMERYFESSAG